MTDKKQKLSLELEQTKPTVALRQEVDLTELGIATNTLLSAIRLHRKGSSEVNLRMYMQDVLDLLVADPTEEK